MESRAATSRSRSRSRGGSGRGCGSVRRPSASRGTTRSSSSRAAREIRADACVVATPAPHALELAWDPPLPGWKRDALAAVRYGQAAKLFLPLAADAPPSQTLSVPERFWTWTQNRPDGSPLPVACSFAGSEAGLAALAVARGPDTWAAAIARLRPDLVRTDAVPVLATWHDDPWARGAYSARSLSSPLDDASLARRVGPVAFAGEHTAGDWHGLMEGALRSGLSCRGGRPRRARDGPVSRVDVLVLGAGLAGLACARDLARAGTDVLVVEARGRPGGRVERHPLSDGRAVELGGELVGHAHRHYLELAGELGLGLEPSYVEEQGETAYDLHEGVVFGEQWLDAGGRASLERFEARTGPDRGRARPGRSVVAPGRRSARPALGRRPPPCVCGDDERLPVRAAPLARDRGRHRRAGVGSRRGARGGRGRLPDERRHGLGGPAPGPWQRQPGDGSGG